MTYPRRSRRPDSRDPQDWLGGDDVNVGSNPQTPTLSPGGRVVAQSPQFIVPEWSKRQILWREAFALVEEVPGLCAVSHPSNDYQQFNLLWRRASAHGCRRLGLGCSVARQESTSHTFDSISASLFKCTRSTVLDLYEATSGRTVERWWDVEGLLNTPRWGGFLQQHRPVDD